VATLVDLIAKHMTIAYHTHPARNIGNVWDLWTVIRQFDPADRAELRHRSRDGRRQRLDRAAHVALKPSVPRGQGRLTRRPDSTWTSEFPADRTGMVDFKGMFTLHSAGFNGRSTSSTRRSAQVGCRDVDGDARDRFVTIVKRDLVAFAVDERRISAVIRHAHKGVPYL
jgi:hypothetical protein